jgi:putative endonuclease
MEKVLSTSWCVYLLQCSDNSYYTGITGDLEDRLERHSTGRGAEYTKAHLPIKLVLVIPVKDQSEAMVKEKWLKRQTQAVKKSLIAEWPKASPERG